MHLDRAELQLLLLAARDAAWSARAEQERARLPRLASADAYERLAARLEGELVHACAQAGGRAARGGDEDTREPMGAGSRAESAAERAFESGSSGLKL